MFLLETEDQKIESLAYLQARYLSFTSSRRIIPYENVLYKITDKSEPTLTFTEDDMEWINTTQNNNHIIVDLRRLNFFLILTRSNVLDVQHNTESRDIGIYFPDRGNKDIRYEFEVDINRNCIIPGNNVPLLINSSQFIPYDKLTNTNVVVASNGKGKDKRYYTKHRLGQGEFRNNLLSKYKSKCCITGIKTETLLIASHIKAWKMATSEERMDDNNGLLLYSEIDKLFDKGFIVFNKNYKIVPNLTRIGDDKELIKRVKSLEENAGIDSTYHNSILSSYLEAHRMKYYPDLDE